MLGGELFLYLFQSEVLLNPSYAVSAVDKETVFRVELLTTAYNCLAHQQLSENTLKLDKTFTDLYQNTVKWTLVATIRYNPDLIDLFSQIPVDHFFWDEMQINKQGWYFVVKTLDLQTNIYASFRNQDPSNEQQCVRLNPALLTC